MSCRFLFLGKHYEEVGPYPGRDALNGDALQQVGFVAEKSRPPRELMPSNVSGVDSDDESGKSSPGSESAHSWSSASGEEPMLVYCYGFYFVVDNDPQAKELSALSNSAAPTQYLTRMTVIHIIPEHILPRYIGLCPASGRMVYFRTNQYYADSWDGTDGFEMAGFDEGQEQEEEYNWEGRGRTPTLCVLDYLN